MTIPRTATAGGLEPHYKVRITLHGAIIHAAARAEPEIDVDDLGQVHSVDADWIKAHAYGDTIGYIDWSKVTAITWRWAP